MPMSRKRCRAADESVACSDDSTKCPVRADCTAMRAVSTSRISPTRMTSGSWRRIDRRPLAKVMPACSLVWIWLIDGNDVFDRVLDRHDVAAGVVDLGQGGVEGGGLAAARRPGAQHHAEGRPDQAGEDLVGVRRHAEVAHAEERPALVEHPQHAFLAPDGGDRRDPDVDLPAVDPIVIWPSWGRRRSTMFMPAMILSRLTSAGAMAGGRSTASCRAPSMRYRTRRRSSWGSMWMSEARSRMAWVMSRLTTWTTGASSAWTLWTGGVGGAAAVSRPIPRRPGRARGCSRAPGRRCRWRAGCPTAGR